MDSFWSHLLATITGGVIAIAGGFFAKFFSDYQERQSLKSAHAGELRTNLDFLKEFDRIERLKNLTTVLETLPPVPQFFSVRPSKYEYNKVFIATANRLGMLRSPLPEQIVRAHYELQLIFELLELNAEMLRDPGSISTDPQENLNRHRDLLERMEGFCTSTAELIDKLEDAEAS